MGIGSPNIPMKKYRDFLQTKQYVLLGTQTSNFFSYSCIHIFLLQLIKSDREVRSWFYSFSNFTLKMWGTSDTWGSGILIRSVVDFVSGRQGSFPGRGYYGSVGDGAGAWCDLHFWEFDVWLQMTEDVKIKCVPKKSVGSSDPIMIIIIIIIIIIILLCWFLTISPHKRSFQRRVMNPGWHEREDLMNTILEQGGPINHFGGYDFYNLK